MPLLDLGLTLGIGIIIGGFFGHKATKKKAEEDNNIIFNDSDFSFLDGLDFKKFSNCPFDVISAKNHYMKKRINSAIGVEKTEDEKLIEEELTSGVNKALKKLGGMNVKAE